MITDRTAEDVKLAKELRIKYQNGETLTEAEVAQVERGTLSLETLNRIESKINEIATDLNKYAYSVTITTKTWEYTDIFYYKSNFTRWKENLYALIKAYYKYTTTPAIPNSILIYSGVNDIEKILVDIESILDNMILNFRQCGAFECGEE